MLWYYNHLTKHLGDLKTVRLSHGDIPISSSGTSYSEPIPLTMNKNSFTGTVLQGPLWLSVGPGIPFKLHCQCVCGEGVESRGKGNISEDKWKG